MSLRFGFIILSIATLFLSGCADKNKEESFTFSEPESQADGHRESLSLETQLDVNNPTPYFQDLLRNLLATNQVASKVNEYEAAYTKALRAFAKAHEDKSNLANKLLAQKALSAYTDAESRLALHVGSLYDSANEALHKMTGTSKLTSMELRNTSWAQLRKAREFVAKLDIKRVVEERLKYAEKQNSLAKLNRDLDSDAASVRFWLPGFGRSGWEDIEDMFAGGNISRRPPTPIAHVKLNTILLDGEKGLDKPGSVNYNNGFSVDLTNAIVKSMVNSGFIGRTIPLDSNTHVDITPDMLSAERLPPNLMLETIRILRDVAQGAFLKDIVGGYHFDNFFLLKVDATGEETPWKSVLAKPNIAVRFIGYDYWTSEKFNANRNEYADAVSEGSGKVTTKEDLSHIAAVKRRRYKAFILPLITDKRFKREFIGLFDFLLDTPEFKDDQDLKKAFTAQALEAGIADLSSSNGPSMAGVKGVDATQLSWENHSGRLINSNLPFLLNLFGVINANKLTSGITAEVSYYLGNASMGFAGAFANSGSGFDQSSYQLENSIKFSYDFGQAFIVGAIGAVRLNKVHNMSLDGQRYQLDLGVRSGAFSAFLQGIFRDFDTNWDAVGFVGMKLNVREFQTPSYQASVDMVLKSGYSSTHDWVTSLSCSSRLSLNEGANLEASLNLGGLNMASCKLGIQVAR